MNITVIAYAKLFGWEVKRFDVCPVMASLDLPPEFANISCDIADLCDIIKRLPPHGDPQCPFAPREAIFTIPLLDLYPGAHHDDNIRIARLASNVFIEVEGLISAPDFSFNFKAKLPLDLRNV